LSPAGPPAREKPPRGSPGEHGQERITETVTAGPQRQGSRRPPAAETVPLRTVPQDRGITAGTGRPRC
jgi:hypothetical protein